MLPLALKFGGVAVLVIGAGAVGTRKASQLIEAGAEVTMISDQFPGAVPDGVSHTHQRRYERGDLRGFFLVVSATGDSVVNDTIVEEAREERIWLNVVDDPERSSFYFMALHRQGDVTVAVSTDGAAPALAQGVRDRVATALPSNLGDVATALRDERRRLHESGATTENRDWPSRIRELLDEAQP